MRVLITGCGYAGIPLGKRLVAGGHEVLGMRRSAEADSDLGAAGITPVHADVTQPQTLARLAPDFDWVINLVSSSGGTVEEYRAVYLEGTRNLLRWLEPKPPQKFIYTSSTSVYAQNDASVVTEQSPVQPDSITSQVLVETENELLRAYLESGFPASILRVAGIYGPGRGHLFKQFVRGEATVRENGEAFINMIHVEDLAGVISQVALRGRAGEIYNAADDEPVRQIDFFRWLADRLQKPMPPSAPADPARKRGLTNKRVSNAKLRTLGYSFIYPTFREGYLPEIMR